MYPRSTRRRIRGVIAVGLGCGLLAAVAVPATATNHSQNSSADRASSSNNASSAEAADRGTVGHLGRAFGSYVHNEERTYTSGPTGLAVLGCQGEPGMERHGNTAVTELGRFGTAGATHSTVSTEGSGDSKSTVATTRIAGGELLDGLIEFDALKAHSVADVSGTWFSGTMESELVGLRVGGTPIDANTAPNTTIDLELPGLGSIAKVVINKQDEGWVGGQYRVRTEALRIELLADNPLGLSTGTQIHLGVANAQLTGPVDALTAGSAFTSRASLEVGSELAVRHGPTSWAPMPCAGGIRKANLAETDIPGLLTVGAGSSLSQGFTRGKVQALSTNKTGEVDILDGLITADAVTAQAQATSEGVSDEGSGFVNLRIGGKPVAKDGIGPNTELQIAGLGTVTLHKTSTDVDGTGIVVTMIEIVVGTEGLGVPVGTKVEIARAGARIVG